MPLPGGDVPARDGRIGRVREEARNDDDDDGGVDWDAIFGHLSSISKAFFMRKAVQELVCTLIT